MRQFRDAGKFLKWKEAFESKEFKVNLGITMVMVIGSITKFGLSKSKVVPCGVCCLRVEVCLVLCVHCGKWIHGRFARVITVTAKISRHFTCKKCQGNI